MRPGELLGISYNDGDIIVQEGTESKEMYIVQAGKVKVVKNGGEAETLLAILKEGDIFGEMGLIEQKLRSATVKAFGETTVLAIDKEKFLRMVRKDPIFALNLLRQMGERIRYLDAVLSTTLKNLEEVSDELIKARKRLPAQEVVLNRVVSELKVVQGELLKLKDSLQARAEG